MMSMGSPFSLLFNEPQRRYTGALLPQIRPYLVANNGAANPHSQGAMASPPTVDTPGAGTDSAPPSPYTALTKKVRFSLGTDVGVVRYEGGGTKVFATDYRQFPVVTTTPSSGNMSDGSSAHVWRASVVSNAAQIAFRVAGGSASVGFRFIVDGQYVSLTPTTVSSGGRQYIVLDFGSSATRTITCEGVANRSIDGVHVGASDTLTIPSTLRPYRCLVLGDSYVTGTGATVQADGFAMVAGDRLGFEVWCSGNGGTGYNATSTGTLPTVGSRLLADVARMAATGRIDVVIFAAGLNDSTTSLQSQAESAFLALRQRLPQALVFVVGAWNVSAPAGPSATIAQVNAAIEAAVGTRPGFWYFDPADVEYTNDGSHPDTTGHQTLGEWLETEIRNALA